MPSKLHFGKISLSYGFNKSVLTNDLWFVEWSRLWHRINVQRSQALKYKINYNIIIILMLGKRIENQMLTLECLGWDMSSNLDNIHKHGLWIDELQETWVQAKSVKSCTYAALLAPSPKFSGFSAEHSPSPQLLKDADDKQR